MSIDLTPAPRLPRAAFYRPKSIRKTTPNEFQREVVEVFPTHHVCTYKEFIKRDQRETRYNLSRSSECIKRWLDQVGLSLSGKEALDQLANTVLNEKKLPNFAFGATSIEEELYFNAGGNNIANDSTSGQVNFDSVFWLCSQTKLITHIAALQLIKRGKLSLESAVSDYIPEMANPVILDDPNAETLTYKPAKTTMTIKHLLNFSSGLFYVPDLNNPDHLFVPYCAPYTKENALSVFFSRIKGNLPGVPILFEPGESFVYGWSSDILGFVVEKVSGVTLEQYFQENIFKPIGVKASFYLTPDLKDKLIDLSYRRDGKIEAGLHRSPESQMVIERDPAKVHLHFGGVGLYSSLRDYLSILRHLLQIDAGSAQNPILSRQTVQSLFEGALTDDGIEKLTAFLDFGNIFAYKDKMQWSTGLSVCTSDWPGRRRKGTASWAGWANTTFFIDRTTGVAGVIGTQLVPPADPDVVDLTGEFEETLYAGLIE